MFDDLGIENELIAIAILIVGIIVARLGSAATGALLGMLDRRAARLATTDTSIISPRLIAVTRTVVFWLILILAVSFALRQLGVGGIATPLAMVIAYVPQLLVGFTIVVAGHVLGLIARHVAAELADPLTTDSLGPRLLHWAIVIVAVVMGLQHVNVDITFITQLLLIAVAIIGGGLMLAFALGARRHVANLLARRELSRLAVGDRIRLDSLEGEIIAIHDTGIDLATDEGTASIPAWRMAEDCVLRIEKQR